MATASSTRERTTDVVHGLRTLATELRNAPRALRPDAARRLAGQLRRLAVSDVAPPALPGDLVGRSCTAAAAGHHRDRLLDLLASATDDPVTSARLGFHAASLARALDRSGASQPLVSVVIPVHDRAHLVGEAVDSALRQTHAAVEVIVVDDGSTDDPAAALGSRDPRIRCVRQVHAGPAAARNRGVRLARGELVHFLDSDDRLDPECLARLVDAFGRVADADLCFCGMRATGRRTGFVPDVEAFGGEDCPTHDLLAAAIRRAPFWIGSVLLPRWLLLATGPLDEDLRWGEDSRYWFRVALRDPKPIGVRATLGTRRFHPASLVNDREQAEQAGTRVAVLNLVDLLERPDRWRYVGRALKKLRRTERWHRLEQPGDARMTAARDALLRWIEASGARRGGLSPQLVLALLQAQVEQVAPPEAGFAQRLRAACEQALARAAEPGPADVAHWMRVGTPVVREDRPAVDLLLRSLDRSTRSAAPWWPLSRLPELSDLRPSHPARRRWRLLARLDPWLGERLSCRMVNRVEAWAARGPHRHGHDAASREAPHA